MTEPTKAATEAAYAAAADLLDEPALAFWGRVGRRTVDRLDLPRGARVLDACCGTGASAIPAAQAVGPAGSVVGVDLAEPALVRARARADVLGLTNIEFRHADIEQAGLDGSSFDAVVCVFGVFFLPDMVAGVRGLWRLVRPGGRLAITVWGADLFEPGTGAFWSAVGAQRPDLVRGYQPWTRLDDPDTVTHLLRAAGVPDPRIEEEAGQQPLPSPDDWWAVVLGTGFQATIAQLGPEATRRVRAANLAWARALPLTAVRTDVIYTVSATATHKISQE